MTVAIPRKPVTKFPIVLVQNITPLLITVALPLFLSLLVAMPLAAQQTLPIRLGHTYWINSVVFSPNGRYLASGGKDETVRLWEVESGRLVRVLEGHTGGVTSVAFSPDGRYLASGGKDETVRLWEVESGRLVRVLEGYGGSVYSVAFSPDGRYLASGNGDNTVHLWEVESGRLVAGVIFTILQNTANHYVIFTADGRYDVSDDAVAKYMTVLNQSGAVGEYKYRVYQSRPEKRVKGLWQQLGIGVTRTIHKKH